MKGKQTIVVIGGAQGGPIAAARAREFDEHARIILLEKAGHVSWVQAGLKAHLTGDIQGDLQELDTQRSSFFERRYRIEVRTHAEVVGLDNDARRVLVQTPDGPERVRYDAVIFAGGAKTSRPAHLDLGGPGVTGFKNLDDLNAIRGLIKAGAKRAVILGGGGYGVDAAGGLLAQGLDVTVVEAKSRILPGYSITAARAAARALTDAGATLYTGDPVERVERTSETGRTLTLKSGRSLEADLVVLATGLTPRSQLLKEAGASLHRDGTIRVDRHMQTTLARVYACGTAVSVPHAVTGGATWLAQDAIIDRTAQIAGRSAAVGPQGVREELSPVAGTELLDVGGHWFGRTGLSDAQARSALGDERVCVVTVHSWSSEIWLGGDVVTVRIVVDKRHHRVVGGEVWGKRGTGVPRRIDILAAAVLEGWSPSRVADLDVAYHPSTGPAYDPVNAAGTLAAMTIAGETTAMDPEVLTLKIAQGEPIQLVDVGKGDRGDADIWPGGTVHMPLEDLREHIGELDPERPAVLLSHTGRRAHIASRILAQRGFAEVYFLDGGALTWRLMRDGRSS